MSVNVCVCRFCVDPREHGHSAQHGLKLYNGMYTARPKGAFVPKPSASGEVSNTALMLLELGKHPVLMLQGHRGCAAVKVLFNSHGKKPEELNSTEKEFRRSHLDALLAVKRMAGHMPLERQLTLLEKTCVLQSVNNLFAYADIAARIGTENCPSVYAYYSLTPLDVPPAEFEGRVKPEDIGLMIYNAARNAFTRPDGEESNQGVRISDLIDVRTFTPLHAGDDFRIQKPVDLEEVVYNQIQLQRNVGDGNNPGVEKHLTA